MPFSLGMWGSAFAASLDEIFLKTSGRGLSFLDWLKDSVNITGEDRDPPTKPTPSPQYLFPAKDPGRGLRNEGEGLGCPIQFREVLRRYLLV